MKCSFVTSFFCDKANLLVGPRSHHVFTLIHSSKSSPNYDSTVDTFLTHIISADNWNLLAWVLVLSPTIEVIFVGQFCPQCNPIEYVRMSQNWQVFKDTALVKLPNLCLIRHWHRNTPTWLFNLFKLGCTSRPSFHICCLKNDFYLPTTWNPANR